MDMPKPRLPYLHKETTRHGKVNWYVRVGHGPRTRLHSEFGTKKFTAEYQAAISGNPIIVNGEDKNSLKWLIGRFRRSAEWEMLSKGTKKQRDHFFHAIIEASGNVPYRAIKKQNILDGIDRRKKTPGAANNFLRTLKALFKWAKESDYIDQNPTEGIKKLQYKSDGFPIWTLNEVTQYREKWAIGTRERLAMELLLWTGLRRGDIVRLGKQHIKNNKAMIPTEKGEQPIYITITPELKQLISVSPTGDMALIATESGYPRNKDAYGNWFRKACRAAGVKKSSHGLRKLAATLLAEAGGTQNELRAAFGWKTDAMARFYTEKADKNRLSSKAAERRILSENSNAIPAPSSLVRE